MIQHLEAVLAKALEGLGYSYPAGVVVSEPPAHVAADYAVNVALQVGKANNQNPREVAEKIKAALLTNGDIEAIEIAGPGFLNIELSDAAYATQLRELQGNLIPQAPESKKVVVEYISANPTGPLHIGNARGGPMGETIARVLEVQGHQIHRDFYVNDIGGQADKFGASVLHYYKEALGEESTFPEKGYPAEYVQVLGKQFAEQHGRSWLELSEADQLSAVRQASINSITENIKKTAERMGIFFDTWSLQGELETSGRATATLEVLKAKEAVFEKDGALWLKSGLAEDDRETVLVKSDGAHTYFLDDIAFYRMKLEEWQKDYGVCVLGANHSGHIPRMQAGLQAIGLDPKRYQGTLYQYVQLKEDGETRRMAKREGTFVTADEVLDQIPLDVFNWFMLSKAPETHLDFDLAAAKDTSEKNPVYYVQYAHARIHSILSKANQEGGVPTETSFNPEERALIRQLSGFAATVKEVGETYRTHLISTYLHELATRFHHFYAHHRILNESTTPQRLALSQATARTLECGLRLMNITAPESMGL